MGNTKVVNSYKISSKLNLEDHLRQLDFELDCKLRKKVSIEKEISELLESKRKTIERLTKILGEKYVKPV